MCYNNLNIFHIGGNVLNIKSLVLPPIGTNCYILSDDLNKCAVVIDPGFPARPSAFIFRTRKC